MAADRFGKGWMSKPALELFQIATVLGGFERKELIWRIALRSDPKRRTNAATVARCLQEMRDAR